MSLFSFFSKDSKDKRAITGLQKTLMQPFQQTQERKRAAEDLAKVGTPEAIAALLRRFEFRIENHTNDEDEKEHVHDLLIGLGEAAVEPILAYIRSETNLFWPIKALRRIAGDERTATYLLDTIAGFTDVYGKNRDRLNQLVDNIRAFASDQRVYDRLKALAQDDDEEIVLRAIDGLMIRQDAEVVALAVRKLVDPEVSQRLKNVIMELLAQSEWSLGDHAAEVEPVVPANYTIDAGGVVRRK